MAPAPAIGQSRPASPDRAAAAAQVQAEVEEDSDDDAI